MEIEPGIAAYLQQVKIPLRLACTTGSGWPMLLSLWYLYEDGLLYCATQQTAKVVGYLGQDSRCAFEVAADQPPYCGVRGQAIAHLDAAQGDDVLARLLVRYLGDTENALARKLLARREAEVAIVLRPVKLFTWNYQHRMQGEEKLCPP